MHTNVHTYTHTYICSLWGSLGGMGTQRESTEDRPWEGSPKGGVANEFYGELTMKKPWDAQGPFLGEAGSQLKLVVQERLGRNAFK